MGPHARPGFPDYRRAPRRRDASAARGSLGYPNRSAGSPRLRSRAVGAELLVDVERAFRGGLCGRLVAVPASGAGLGDDRRERLRERVGEVAEDVGRVVVLDELVGVLETAPLPFGVLGLDLGPEVAVRCEQEPLVLVVDDDQVAEPHRQTSCGVLEL